MANVWNWFIKEMNKSLFALVVGLLTLGGVSALWLQARTAEAQIRVDSIIVNTPVSVNAPLSWSDVICSKSDQVIDIAYSVHLLNKTTHEETTIPGTLSESIEPNGCNRAEPHLTRLSAPLSEGTWELRLVGYYTPVRGFIQLFSKTSNPFEVQGE